MSRIRFVLYVVPFRSGYIHRKGIHTCTRGILIHLKVLFVLIKVNGSIMSNTHYGINYTCISYVSVVLYALQ